MFKLALIAIHFVIASLSFEASATFDVSVAAGQHERSNVPVRIPMPSQIGKDRIRSVTLVGQDGKSIPAQLTGPGLLSSAAGELHFVAPHLGPGKTVHFKAIVSADRLPSTAGFTWRDHPGHHTDLLFGERPVLRY